MLPGSEFPHRRRVRRRNYFHGIYDFIGLRTRTVFRAHQNVKIEKYLVGKGIRVRDNRARADSQNSFARAEGVDSFICWLSELQLGDPQRQSENSPKELRWPKRWAKGARPRCCYQWATSTYSAKSPGSAVRESSFTPGTSSPFSIPRSARSSATTYTGICRFSIRSRTSRSILGAWV